jgi:hypothetical protein
MSHDHWRERVLLIVIAAIATLASCTSQPQGVADKLAEWRQGVWISGSGTYTIYTDSHYFVLSYTGDSTRPNIYCGASQVQYHDKGMARMQTIRLRQFPGSAISLYRATEFTDEHTETPMPYDTLLFTPGKCVIEEGVIYDAVTEVTDEYILLATCNGDHEKIFANGVSAYMPASGGEFYSYRVEELR